MGRYTTDADSEFPKFIRYTRGQSINTQRTITAKRIGTLHGLISTFSLYRKAIWDVKHKTQGCLGSLESDWERELVVFMADVTKL